MAGFDELLEIQENDESLSKDFKPIWKVNLKNKDEVLSWLKEEFKYLLNLNKPRHTLMIENLMIYQGLQFSPDDKKTLNDFLDTGRVNSNKRNQKLIVNHLYDITETIVARTTRNVPAPDVQPANSNEIHDRNAAKGVKQLLDYLARINEIKTKDIQIQRLALIGGESYVSTLWDKDKGDIHPLWAEAKQLGFVDEFGEPIRDADGNRLDPKKPLRVGEVDVKVLEPWRVLIDERESFDCSNYSFIIDVADVEELKSDYPKKKNVIKPMEGQRIFDTHRMSFRHLRNESFKITFHHKKTKYLPEGLEVIFTLETILEMGDMPYDHGGLAIDRLTDIDVPSKLHGMSFYELTKHIQWRHNQLSSDIITNQRLCAKPKWIVPKGRTNLQSLGNDITIVQFSGNVPPRLETFNPTPQEIFIFRDKLKEELEQISTVTGTARRNPPSGARASVSMRFLSELEAERTSVATFKHNELIRAVYEKMMSVAGTFYEADDGRTMRVLGNDEEFYIRDIQVSNLNKSYDVIINTISAQAESRSSREARIFDIIDLKPDLMTDEQLIDVLELGSSDKMTSIVTESLRSAENENEKIFNGDPVQEPARYEEHIIHWRVHVQKLQSLSIKENADPADIGALEEHIFGTEFLMTEKGKENPTFSAELAKLSLFPIYYRDGQGFSPSSLKQQEAVVQGQANRGDELTEKIGAEPIEKLDFNRNPKEESK